MAHVGGVVPEATTNRVAPVLSSSESALRHCKFEQLPQKKCILDK
jgi:hypothetical protein